ncbi:MAG: DNA-directed RNA polymerase subunit omega [Eubacteriales bacterium]|nr:DNA-directed RNA polymerase subunit omega [Eubacteriales bacterium]
MLRPTYMDLMDKTNATVTENEEPIVKSRYSIVLAAAKRARQIVAEEPELIDDPSVKALSVAVKELDEGKVQILGSGE